jgi:hypothetical protein
VTCRDAAAGAAAPKLRRAVWRELEEEEVDDAQDAALACERCEHDNDEPELGLVGERSSRGGSKRCEAREEGSECAEGWGGAQAGAEDLEDLAAFEACTP